MSTHEGKNERDEAIDRVGANADQRWKEDAYDAIFRLALRQRTVTADDLWEVVRKPREPRAAGYIFLWARRMGYIEETGDHVQSANKINHYRPIRVWRSLIYGQQQDEPIRIRV